MTYRPDVDGLRAIAVLSVIGFHAFPSWVRGGYVGVDVFFVISGFLISGIIFDALDNSRFSFTDFYARRIRRIFPALSIVLATCLVVGWFTLVASRYKELGEEAAGGAAFVANFVFWREAGYFDAAADTKPLLHLWSLGVEEQFYLVWPLLLVLASRLRLGLTLVAGGLLLLSLTLNVLRIDVDAIGTFYSPVTRFWELMSGAVLAAATASRPGSGARWLRHAQRPLVREALGLLGVGAILVAALWLDRSHAFPGVWALLPVGGTMMAIAAGSDAWLNRTALAWRPLVAIGLISYPLYLWHWPLLSFARLITGETPPALVRSIALVASAALAWLTYRWAEVPIRFGRSRRFAVPALAVAMVMVAAAGLFVLRREGLVSRSVNLTERASFIEYHLTMRLRGLARIYRFECDFLAFETSGIREHLDPACTAPGRAHTILLWGDSHAQALSWGIRALLPADTSLAQVTTSSCLPALAPVDAGQATALCTKSNGFALSTIAALRPELVVIAQHSRHEETDWAALVEHLRGLGVLRVILVGPLPMWIPSLPEVITTHYWGKAHDSVSQGLQIGRAELDRRLAAKMRGVPLTYVSLIEQLCGADGCTATVPGTNPPALIAFDEAHLTPDGSLYVVKQALRAALLPSAAP